MNGISVYEISPYFAPNPYFLHIDSLTLFPNTELYQMMQCGKFIPAGEKERLEELITLIENPRLRTRLQANTITNYKPITGYLPKEREQIVSELKAVIENTSEEEMKEYRNSLNSLGM